jgi:hypothetical protein
MTVGGNYAIDVTADKSSEFTLEIRASDQLPFETGQ